ncbi:hypothetical protein AAFP35_20355 [Gordonia sp. CPCC 206044]|uniref:hypothetical protein n=1 Tax=Gordonia sp. CPCC 206044 TaxID=3140793 RepID=UPI003AF35811
MTSESADVARRSKDWRAKRRLADVFGDDLPEVTSDECEEGHKGLGKGWFEANRPPHYE